MSQSAGPYLLSCLPYKILLKFRREVLTSCTQQILCTCSGLDVKFGEKWKVCRNFGVLGRRPEELVVEMVFLPDLPVNTDNFGTKLNITNSQVTLSTIF